ncbi:hypothetical protein ACHHV8_26625 [Paenibacillus sp. TAB 01]|uniref:hypothetical protein n=1 Tax=Paenibacillus sp. TAB 01 TaxID=3368988 RepID=UPI0037527BE9
MKIALDNVAPTQDAFEQMLSCMKEGRGTDAALQYEVYCSSPYVIAAYDQGKLVGLGRVASGDEAAGGCDIKVLDPYRGREIEDYMRKLLSVHRI